MMSSWVDGASLVRSDETAAILRALRRNRMLNLFEEYRSD